MIDNGAWNVQNDRQGATAPQLLGTPQRVVLGIAALLLLVAAFGFPLLKGDYEWLSVASLGAASLLGYLALTGQSLAEVGTKGLRLTAAERRIKLTAADAEHDIERAKQQALKEIRERGESARAARRYAGDGQAAVKKLAAQGDFLVDRPGVFANPATGNINTLNTLRTPSGDKIGIEFLHQIGPEEAPRLGELLEFYRSENLPLLVVTAEEPDGWLLTEVSQHGKVVTVHDVSAEAGERVLLEAVLELAEKASQARDLVAESNQEGNTDGSL